MSDANEVIEKITIDGETLEFVTREGKTYLKKEYELTDSKNDDQEQIKLPDIIVVTRKNGMILFVLRAPREGLKFVTAQTLYDKYQYQWFEPLADNYRELIYLNNKEYTKDAYKHFTWKEIDDFTSEKRFPLAFQPGWSGDWKNSRLGGDKYLMVMVDNYPYWADAVGQIPFSINTYRSCQSIKDVVKVGIEWGPGDIKSRFEGKFDNTNKYDNYFVLRGALYASKKYSYTIRKNAGGQYPAVNIVEEINAVDPSQLGNSINNHEVTKYAAWDR